MEQILLKQKPVIEHQLEAIGKNVDKRINDLNIQSLVATEDTRKSLKNLRSELNAELKDFEEKRKYVKNAILTPYNDFEEKYKSEISEKYKGAISTLKDKIMSVEIKIKEEKQKEVEEFFNELCQSEQIDFLKFSDTKINIDLSTSMKRYQNECIVFVQKVADDIKLINSEEHAAEMMVEYKKTLNASGAITAVRERKEAERIEKERILQERTNKRVNRLQSMLFVFHDLTDTYSFVHNDAITIAYSDIEKMEEKEWNKALVALENEVKAMEKEEKKSEPDLETPTQQQPEQKQPEQAKTEPLKPPTPQVEAKKYTATFEVVGTMAQLKQLGQYMEENNINYENI